VCVVGHVALGALDWFKVKWAKHFYVNTGPYTEYIYMFSFDNF